MMTGGMKCRLKYLDVEVGLAKKLLCRDFLYCHSIFAKVARTVNRLNDTLLFFSYDTVFPIYHYCVILI